MKAKTFQEILYPFFTVGRVLAAFHSDCSAGFQACCIADFQVGSWAIDTGLAGWETCDTADWDVCATRAES